MPNPAQYQAKPEAYRQEEDPRALHPEAPRIIAALIAGVPEQALHQRPLPDKWSVGEIIAHLAEDELVSSWRYRQMIENSGRVLPAFDQDEWVRLGNYALWNPWDSLLLFRLLREANVPMLNRLSADEWERFGLHEELGKITVRDLVWQMAGHDINHLDQIRAVLGRTPNF